MQLNKFDVLKKIFAVVSIFSLIVPAPAYSARPVETANAPTVDSLSANILQTTNWGARSELRREIITGFDKETKYFTNSVAVYNLSSLLNNPLEQIPDNVMAKIREKLALSVAAKDIKSGLAHDVAGNTIILHLTHNRDELNASVHKLMLDAVKAGLVELEAKGGLNVKLANLSDDDLIHKLIITPDDESKVERPAESVGIAIGVGVGIGAANIKLFREFAIPGSTPLQKLGLSKSPGFRFRVKRTKDIIAGNYNGKEWEFEISHTQYDEKTETVKVLDEKGQVIYEGTNESVLLLALASQPNDYQITAVYPVEGGSLPTNEPIATVVYQPVFGSNGQAVLNPVIIYRSQSGADAVGGIGNMINGLPNFVPGGENGEHFVVTKPATLEEARKAPKEGIGYFAYIGWQSRNNGEIPVEGIRDHVGLNNFGYFAQKEFADKLAAVMVDHQDDQPYLSPEASEKKVEAIRAAQNPRFVFAPKESEVDPFLAEVQAKIEREELGIVTDDKADVGGRWGHTNVPEMYLAIEQASHMEAIEQGTITDGQIIGRAGKHQPIKDVENIGVGDDMHAPTLGDKSPNGAETHQHSFTLFTRAILFAIVTGKKYYGIGQDFAGPEAQAAKKNPFAYAKLTDRFFELLEQVMPESEKKLGTIEKVRKAWEEWKAKGTSGVEIAEPFSGNVSQQGIGSARYAFDLKTEKGFDIIAGDKMGPAAFNRVIKHMVYNALEAGKFSNGLVFEIWDLKAFDEHGKIPFADIPKKYNDVRMLLESALEGKISKKDLEKVLTKAYADGKFLSSLNDQDRKEVEKIFRASGFLPNTPEAFEKDGRIKLEAFPQQAQAAREFLEKALIGKLKRADFDWVQAQVYGNNGQLSNKLNGEEKVRLEEILRKSGYVPAKRIFLDAQKDKNEIIRYLADSDRFNVKHVWGKKSSGWDIESAAQFLDRPLMGASVTRLGILSGGEYLGKDDPVMVGHSELMHFAHEFLRTHPLIIQGDMNGSHWEAAMVSAMDQAVATLRSFPILVGLRYTVSPDGKKFARVQDIYGKKSYDKIRKEMSRFNFHFDLAQMSQFEPHGTNSKTVEAAYELAKILARLNKDNSPYLVENKKKARPTRFFADPAANHLDKLYQTVANLRSEVRKAGTAEQPSVVIDLQPLNIPQIDTAARQKVAGAFLSHSRNREAVILSEGFLQKGGLAFVHTLFTGPAVALTRDPKLIAQVEAYNKQFPNQLPVIVADPAHIKAARELLRKEIAREVSLLGGSTPGTYKERAVVSDDDLAIRAALLKEKELELTTFLETDISRMAGNLGLADVVAKLVQSLATAKSA